MDTEQPQNGEYTSDMFPRDADESDDSTLEDTGFPQRKNTSLRGIVAKLIQGTCSYFLTILGAILRRNIMMFITKMVILKYVYMYLQLKTNEASK